MYSSINIPKTTPQIYLTTQKTPNSDKSSTNFFPHSEPDHSAFSLSTRICPPHTRHFLPISLIGGLKPQSRQINHFSHVRAIFCSSHANRFNITDSHLRGVAAQRLYAPTLLPKECWDVRMLLAGVD